MYESVHETGYFAFQSPPREWISNGIRLPDRQGGRYGDLASPRMLPLRPLWPGFAINTVFYAAVLWGLFAFPFALRRTIRRRRGQCPACGYPVGTSPRCTECGKPVRTHA